MRILRGQSNREVSSKGFALFVVGLVIATFIGGALRTLLGSDQVHARIVAELKARFPRQEFQIGRIEVLLSRGLWPALGLRAHDLIFKQDVCGKLSFVLTLPEAILPLDLWSLRHGAYRLKEVQVNGGELHLDYRACPNTPPPTPPPKIAEKPSEPPLHSSVIAPKLNWQEAAKFVDSVLLTNFTISYEKSPTWKLNLKTADLSLGAKVEFAANIQIAKSLPFGTFTQPVLFDLRGDGASLTWNINSELKEGIVHVGGVNDQSTGEAHIQAELRQIPIKDLMAELNQTGLLERDLKLKATWLSCKLDWKGHLEQYAVEPLTIASCGAEGGYGKAELDPAAMYLDGSYFHEPARIHVHELQMQPFLEAVNREVLPAVIQKLGAWSGEIAFSNAREWKLAGELKDLEIAFSSSAGRGKQVVDSVRTVVDTHARTVHADVSEVKLHEGVFDGRADFDLSEDWRDGTFNVSINDFSLSPAVQKLMLGGPIGATHGAGKGILLGGELKTWRGNLEIADLRGDGWKASTLRLNSRFRSGVFHIDALVESASADASWKLYPQLRRAEPALGENADFKNLTANLDIDHAGGRIESLSARQNDPARGWKVRGNWIREGEFEGKLNLASARQNRSFDLRGERGHLVVETATEGEP